MVRASTSRLPSMPLAFFLSVNKRLQTYETLATVEAVRTSDVTCNE